MHSLIFQYYCMTNQLIIIFTFTETLCTTTAGSRIPSWRVHTAPSKQFMCAHVLVRVLGWNVVSVGTKAVLRETARQKKRCCRSFQTKEFSCKHRAVQASVVRVYSYSNKIEKFWNCTRVCLESSTWSLPFFFFLF